MDEYKLCEAIIKKREELHLTQEGLVSYIGEEQISLSTIKRIERRVKISKRKATIVLSALDLDINDFLP